MLDIASVGNGLVGPGREVSEAAPRQMDPASPSRHGDQAATPHSPRAVDRVDVSEHAGLMARLNGVPEVRWDRIEAVRSDIKQDGYLDRHLNDAIDRLLSDV